MECINKKLLVIVPGSKTKESPLPLLRPLLKKFYAHFGVQVEGDTWLPALQQCFREIPAEVIIFEWSGGISPFAIRKAAKELAHLLSAHAEREVMIFAKSLGGSIALSVACDTAIQISRVVCVATPHSKFERLPPASVKVVNIYSPEDSYQRLANRALFFGMGRPDIPYARNIKLSGISHSGFNHDGEVDYEGSRTRLFNLYRNLLADSI